MERGAQQSPDGEHPSELGTHLDTERPMGNPATRDNAATGMKRRFNERLGDAQGKAGQESFLLVRFLRAS